MIGTKVRVKKTERLSLATKYTKHAMDGDTLSDVWIVISPELIGEVSVGWGKDTYVTVVWPIIPGFSLVTTMPVEKLTEA